jgi:anti-sigma B factor antagonist
MTDDEGLLEVAVESSAASIRLVLRGDLDISTAPILDDRVRTIRPLRQPLVLDVSELLFIDSTGLRSLTSVRRSAIEDVGAPVTLVGCREPLRKLLEMTGLSGAFDGLS